MEADGQQWFDALREKINELRAQSPIPLRESLSLELEMQCRVIGGALIAWLEHHGPRLIFERSSTFQPLKLASDPYVLVLADVPGLVAANEIVGPNHPRVAFLLATERPATEETLVRSAFQWHVEYETWFREGLDAASDHIREAHPIQPGEKYWLHTENTYTGPRMGIGFDHLWKWNGSDLSLLEEAIFRRVY